MRASKGGIMRIARNGGVKLAAFAAGFAALAAWAEGDAGRGAQAFRACAPCHSTVPGRHTTGPSLAHVWGRKAATAPGFTRYSDALAKSGLTWDAMTLDKWLAGPAKLVPGTAMSYPGLDDAQARADVIAYLKAVSEGHAPPAPKGGGMMGGGMMGGGKIDLKKAPPAGQVTKLTHCKDTYTVATADGRVEKVWEFNLRLKTDSSDLGPREGHPVAIGAGMMGDRASIVFAKPSEISPFIGVECAGK
jgi:cytochrome c